MAVLGLKITIMHQIYEVDPTSQRDLARLVICFHFFRLSRAKRNLKKNHSGVVRLSKNGANHKGYETLKFAPYMGKAKTEKSCNGASKTLKLAITV
jgi:hypothetical protein